MKILSMMLVGASVFALTSCGVGSPEDAAAKMTELEYEVKMKKLDHKEQNIEPEVEILKFQNEIRAKYGKDEAAMAKFEEAYEKKLNELKAKYEDREKEIERKYEDQKTQLDRERDAIKAKSADLKL